MVFLQEKHRVYICIAGIFVSIYAYVVEYSVHYDSSYEPMCEFNKDWNCTAAFKSEYGVGFGIIGKLFGKDFFLNLPNSVFGLIYFIIQVTGIFMDDEKISKKLFWISLIGLLFCVYLAYLLFFVIGSVCIVCLLTYALTYCTHHLNKYARRRFLTTRSTSSHRSSKAKSLLNKILKPDKSTSDLSQVSDREESVNGSRFSVKRHNLRSSSD